MSDGWLRKLAVVFVLMACWLSAAAVKVLTSPAAWLYTGACALALGFTWLSVWHHQKMTALRAEWLIRGEWTRLPSYKMREVWACPYCAQPCHSWALVKVHQDPATSPCGVMVAQRVALERAEKASKDGVNMAHLVGSNGAGIDTLTEDNEGS